MAKDAVDVADTTNQTVAEAGRQLASRSATSSRSSPRSPSRPTCWRSTPPSRRRGPARPARASRSSPTRSRSWPRRPPRRPRTSAARSRRSRPTPRAPCTRSAQISALITQIDDVSNTIASAVEEQTATTNEIGRNITRGGARVGGDRAQHRGRGRRRAGLRPGRGRHAEGGPVADRDGRPAAGARREVLDVAPAGRPAMSDVKRIGVLTGGGDAPGLNAVIRAVVKSALQRGHRVRRARDSFDGLIEPDRSRLAHPEGRHRHPAHRRHDPRHEQPRRPVRLPGRRRSRGRSTTRRASLEMFHKLGLDALIVIGGDGTLAIAAQVLPARAFRSSASRRRSTTTSSARRARSASTRAVAFATDAIDRLHTTAEAHHRIIVVEVMGRYAGWIALHAGHRRRGGRHPDPRDPVRPREDRPRRSASATAGARASASSSWPRGRGRSAGQRSVKAAAAASGGHGAAGRRRRAASAPNSSG